MSLRRLTERAGIVALAAAIGACAKSSTPGPSTPSPAGPATATFTVTFDQNPVPYRPTGCSFSTPEGWFASVRIQETSGVAFTPSSLTQRLDGNTVSFLSESFASRFGACSGSTFTPGAIAANGAVCGTVGVCTSSAYSSYQFSVAGSDANGHTLTITSPVLQLGARP
jgi:hypothetical protein